MTRPYTHTDHSYTYHKPGRMVVDTLITGIHTYAIHTYTHIIHTHTHTPAKYQTHIRTTIYMDAYTLTHIDIDIHTYMHTASTDIPYIPRPTTFTRT